MIGIAVHLRDRVVAFGLVNLDEDGLHGGRSLVGNDVKGCERLVAVFEGVSRGRTERGQRARAAGVGLVVIGCLHVAVPRQKNAGRGRVAGQVDLVGVGGVLGGPAGFDLPGVNLRRDVVGLAWRDKQIGRRRGRVSRLWERHKQADKQGQYQRKQSRTVLHCGLLDRSHVRNTHRHSIS